VDTSPTDLSAALLAESQKEAEHAPESRQATPARLPPRTAKP
jgi:hypothetical protein